MFYKSKSKSSCINSVLNFALLFGCVFFCYVYDLVPFLAIYSICSMHFGILISKLLKLNDPRSIGSGNAGATNVFRSNKLAGVMTFLLDAGKVAFCFYITSFCWNYDLSDYIANVLNRDCLSFAQFFQSFDSFQSFARSVTMREFVSILCIAGHIFPIYRLIFSNIKPAKGIATFFGSVFFLSSIGGFISIGIWLISLALFKTSAISGILSVLAFCLYGYCYSEISLIYGVFVSILIIYAHRSNLKKIFLNVK